MPQVVNQSIPEDQISPKLVLLKIVSVKDSLVKNWKLILLFCVIGYGIGFALDLYLKKRDQYQATVLFNLGSGGGSTGGIGDVAGLLGLGSTPDANIFTGENFFYFVKSRPVVERALMKEVEVGSKKMLLANFYIDSSAILENEWKENEKLQNFHFTKNDPKEFNMQERLALNDVLERIRVGTDVYQPDRKSSFIMIQVTIENPLLSETWANILLETVEEVYTENQTSKTRRTLNLLQNRADSLSRILGGTENRLARQIDYSTNIVDPVGKVQVNRLQRSSEFVQQLYMEAMRNVEAMKVSLVREAPLFTIIEPVKNPVDRKSDEGKRAQIGLLLGLLLALVFIYFKSVYAAIMSDPRA
ncbi:hypothetical protein [Arundinibacter roseus]|uniref:Lipopolysaccharide biosynthesis protein n=1 Tax=Arundinibacter roseus TaxID=2070510 RepID=A0A4R4K9T5_9BACT|nr:hypothetical protein [Arundinibacter roseus]TDB64480.1 hypothetical protein EZE20_12445 [Arundinibacter roseus]